LTTPDFSKGDELGINNPWGRLTKTIYGS
jgi:hypothetical protein